MKILMITRLMSGFVSSIESGAWSPMGTPAIYRIVNHFDQKMNFDLLFTLKAFERLDERFLNRPLSISGLTTKPTILPGPSACSKWLGPFRTYLSECRQCWNVYRRVKKTRPDFVYIDRANVLLGAVISRFTKVPVHLRLLGTPPTMETLLSKPALSHYLYRWAYRSPFSRVLCSRDGSPGEQWMQRALDPKIPKKRWVNGVDAISEVRELSSLIRLVLIGRLNHLKRIDQAVDVLLQLPEKLLTAIHVDIIGDGELFGKIKDSIKTSKYASQFTLHGAIPHHLVLKYLAQNDILISLNTHGNLTNTVLEAIRCGLCLALPEADCKTGVDVDTYTVIPEHSVICLKQDDLLSDLKKQLTILINQPDKIRYYQEKTREISKTIDTWDRRIEREAQLFKPYDLAIVISDLRGGGTQKVLERLLNQWVVCGKRILIVTLDVAKNDCIHLPDVVDRIELGGIAESSNAFMGLIANFRRMRQIRNTLRRINPPIVLSFLSAVNVLTVLATRGLSCRLIISERNDPEKQSFGRIWDYLRKKCYRYADVVTANSHSAIESMLKFVDPSQCHYVPNPVVLPESIKAVTLEKPTILAVGRLHEQKAYDVLLEAFSLFHKRHPKWQLLILGEGVLRASLETQIRQLGLFDAVHLKGYVDPFPYLASADIYTMPSRYEGMPNALLEAMGMGLPAVISDALAGPLNFLEDHRDALIVPVGNAERLSEAFSELAEHPELQTLLGGNAKHAVSAFSMESVLPQWEVLFNA